MMIRLPALAPGLSAPALAPILALALAAPAQAQLQISISDQNGSCFVSVPAGDNGLKLEFSVRARDLNTNVVLHNIDGDIVNEALDDDIEPEVDLIFDGTRRHELDWGLYRAGFTYLVAGGFDSPAGARPILRELKESETLTFVADENSWGPISLQHKGVAYGLLENCLLQNGGEMP